MTFSSPRRPLRTVAAAALLLAVAADGRASDSIRDAWARHCGSCHFDGAAEGNLALDAMLDRLAERPTVAGGPDHAAWMSVLRNLRTETMPPADEPRPSADLRRAAGRLRGARRLRPRSRPPRSRPRRAPPAQSHRVCQHHPGSHRPGRRGGGGVAERRHRLRLRHDWRRALDVAAARGEVPRDRGPRGRCGR